MVDSPAAHWAHLEVDLMAASTEATMVAKSVQHSADLKVRKRAGMKATYSVENWEQQLVERKAALTVKHLVARLAATTVESRDVSSAGGMESLSAERRAARSVGSMAESRAREKADNSEHAMADKKELQKDVMWADRWVTYWAHSTVDPLVYWMAAYSASHLVEQTDLTLE